MSDLDELKRLIRAGNSCLRIVTDDEPEAYQLAAGARLHAAFAARREINNGAVADAIRASPPLSVTMAERIQSLRDWARGRCVPAG